MTMRDIMHLAGILKHDIPQRAHVYLYTPHIRGATVFFTVGLRLQGSDTLLREIHLLRSAVARTLRERPVTVNAWVVLPDHMHCIWTLPQGDCDYSTRWRIIKSRFSRNLAKVPLLASDTRRQERGIWNQRFWEHHIRSKADYDSHMEHCWLHPVRHGFVSKPEHWKYTSFAKLRRASA